MGTSLGHGIGLRTKHYPHLLTGGARVPCVEAITENFLERGGRPAAVLERVRQDAQVMLHGVSLSIGGLDPFREDYLVALRALSERIEAAVVSDHLSFGTFGGHAGHDLWPLPLTEEALTHVVERVSKVQEALGRRIALENPSSYLEWTASTIPEEEFLAEVARRADCDILLDLNNVYVSAKNHKFDEVRYIEAIPRGRVVQFHLAGHSVRDGYLFDDHSGRVADPVWALYLEAVTHFGDVTTIIEWDDNVPSLEDLVAEARLAESMASHALARAEEKVA